MHISKHIDKRAATLAMADFSYSLFGKQCPYHARVQRDARIIDGLFFGHLVYVTKSGTSTVWQDDRETVTVDGDGYAKRVS